MISSDEARMIINKWNQESLSMRCDVIVDGGIRFSLIGKIDLLTDEGFGLRASDKRHWVMFPFRIIRYYEYGDSRTANPEHREFIADTYEALLTLKTDFALISLGEVRE